MLSGAGLARVMPMAPAMGMALAWHRTFWAFLMGIALPWLELKGLCNASVVNSDYQPRSHSNTFMYTYMYKHTPVYIYTYMNTYIYIMREGQIRRL